MAASLEHQERALKHPEKPATLWAPAIKIAFGDTYHIVRGGKVALCNPTIRVDATIVESGPPTHSYVCATCRRMAARDSAGVTKEVG